MRTVRVREARRTDAPAILQLETLFPTDRMSLRSIRRFIGSATARVLVAEQDARLLGNLVLLFRAHSAIARIYSVIVSPEARGLGLGARLVRAAEKNALAASRERMSLEVRADNLAARALYLKLGYSVAETLPAYYEDGADGQRLERVLTARR